jgi:hypothetical protein
MFRLELNLFRISTDSGSHHVVFNFSQLSAFPAVTNAMLCMDLLRNL